jgi:hypothetical protein
MDCFNLGMSHGALKLIRAATLVGCPRHKGEIWPVVSNYLYSAYGPPADPAACCATIRMRQCGEHRWMRQYDSGPDRRAEGKRPRPLLSALIEAMERHGHLPLAPEARTALLATGAATIDRGLRETRGPAGYSRHFVRVGSRSHAEAGRRHARNISFDSDTVCRRWNSSGAP